MSPAFRRACAASRKLHCSRLCPLIASITSPGFSVPILCGERMEGGGGRGGEEREGRGREGREERRGEGDRVTCIYK